MLNRVVLTLLLDFKRLTDEVFTHVTITNMIAVFFGFTLTINSGRILKKVCRNYYARQENLGLQILSQLDMLHVFDILVFGLLMGLVQS
jgi:hypothetical protein